MRTLGNFHQYISPGMTCLWWARCKLISYRNVCILLLLLLESPRAKKIVIPHTHAPHARTHARTHTHTHTHTHKQVTLEGQASSTSPVSSGLPHVTVLGPLLFLVCINDLPSGVKATPSLFADDCFLCRIINSPEDAQALQDDQDALQQ